MRVELLFRFLGGVGLAVTGWYVALALTSNVSEDLQLRYAVVFSVTGFALGLLITPWVTLYPTVALRERARRLPALDLVAATIGLVIGLIISALLAIPLSMLPSLLGRLLPFAATVFFAYMGVVTMVARKRDIFNIIGGRLSAHAEGSDHGQQLVVDTSAIIDGRIADVGRTGFIPGTMIVPRFVLNELQHIADSPDMLRRARGRRGLEVLNRLQKESDVPIKFSEVEIDGVTDVDGKLVKLAKHLRCPIITNDFNLNRVAALQGIRVLNINELANAVKSVVLPGEEMVVRIIQEGKEHGQGLGYLDDGTMIVVENGRRYIGRELEITVTRVLQTVAGRMIFAHPKGE
ncbi:MAG: TRAM domain-containing protein [Chloroflexi bacterium]|nr:TRAM domain-containing protein [Chloroflexota bacterium]